MQRAFRFEEIEAFERNVPLVNRIKKLAEERAREMSRNLLGSGIRVISKRMEGKIGGRSEENEGEKKG